VKREKGEGAGGTWQPTPFAAKSLRDASSEDHHGGARRQPYVTRIVP
jgi:hypothetical protein